MQDAASTNNRKGHKFHFKSGVSVEVYWHFGRRCWGADWYKEGGAAWLVGFGPTKNAALTDLREKLARHVSMIMIGIT